MSDLQVVTRELAYYYWLTTWVPIRALLPATSQAVVVRGLREYEIYFVTGGPGGVGGPSADGTAGAGGGVSIYPGDCGLRWLRGAVSVAGPPSHDKVLRNCSIVAMMGNRASVAADFKAMLREAGAAPRGEGQLASVAVREPGYPVRVPNAHELSLLADLLTLINHLGRALRSDNEALRAALGEAPHEGAWLAVSVKPTATDETASTYSLAWCEPADAPMPQTHSISQLQRRQASRIRPGGVFWDTADVECYGFYVHAWVDEGSRRYAPYCFMMVRASSGEVLGTDRAPSPGPSPAHHVAFILRTLKEAGIAPRKLLVSQDEVQAMLSDLAPALRAELVRADTLPGAVAAHDALFREIVERKLKKSRVWREIFGPKPPR